MENLLTQIDAAREGLAHYFTGEPCKHGHISYRYVSNRNCIECHRRQNKNWANKSRAENKEHRLTIERASRERARVRIGEEGLHRRDRTYNLRSKYGIKLEDYERMFEEQGGVCAICGSPPTAHKKNRGHLHVDHDHASGEVRGLLCHRCNLGMVAVDSYSGWPEKAALYALKHRSV